MGSYTQGNDNEQNPNPELFNNPKGRKENCCPEKGKRANFYYQWNTTLFAVIADIFPNKTMIDQPVIPTSGTPGKQKSRQQQKWCGRKHWNRNTNKPQRQRNYTAGNHQILPDRTYLSDFFRIYRLNFPLFISAKNHNDCKET